MRAGTCCKKSAGGVLPGVLLVLMPKCPACLALYLSAATGIGIPFATARYLRILLIAACVGALLLFAWRRWRDWRGYEAGGRAAAGDEVYAETGHETGKRGLREGNGDRGQSGDQAQEGRLWLPRC